MTTAQRISEEARKWLKTPFMHQGRALRVGVDCAGVVVGVAKALGFKYHDVLGYSTIPSNNSLVEHLEQDTVKLSAPEPGCILLMAFSVEPQHLAIYTDIGTIIHAYSKVGECVEHRLDDVWRKRVISSHRFIRG